MFSNHWGMSCKQETYKRLGDYIREVDVRNKDNQLNENDLFGVSVTKEFILTHANLVGVQFHNYKIVRNKQFTYISDTSRRGDKIALALNLFGRDIIVSSVYTTFEVNESKLLPEYLMMWFRRPEFDRYARFKSHGSAREVFDWEEMCNVMMPIPAPEEQQRTVDNYNAIQKRIDNNKQMIAKLEDAAQAIYNKMFVEDVDPENLPEGWKIGTLGETYNIVYGKSLQTSKLTPKGYIVYGGNGMIGYYSQYIYDKPQVLISCRGVASGTVHLTKPYSFVTSNSLVCEQKDKTVGAVYSYYTLTKLDLSQYQSGSAQPQITLNDISNVEMIIPSKEICDSFEKIIDPIIKHKNNIELENEFWEVLLLHLINKM